MSEGIYWFRYDLRVDDNEGLVRAAAKNDRVLPVYVLDRRRLERDQHGVERMGSHPLRFLLESLEDLKTRLCALGSDLRVEIGYPAEVLTELAASRGVSRIYCQAGCAYEEHCDEKTLAGRLDLQTYWGETLYHLDDLPFELADLPDVYTPFRKAVEKGSTVRPPVDAPAKLSTPDGFGTAVPTLESLGFEEPPRDPRAVLSFVGGAGAGHARIDDYFWQKRALSTYKETRNGLIGADDSSKLSPWLAHGCLSPRQIYREIRAYEEQIEKNQSTYWLIFELIWRDFFHFVARKYGSKLFRRSGITGREKIPWGPADDFPLWRDGRTGEPFVDANMRELQATGFMSNRGRQNVASYLMHDMGIDWRLGAAYFEQMLIDYDPCSNYGNWLYIAGVGNDPQGGRRFDIERQKKMYDPEGAYQRLWAEPSA